MNCLRQGLGWEWGAVPCKARGLSWLPQQNLWQPDPRLLPAIPAKRCLPSPVEAPSSRAGCFQTLEEQELGRSSRSSVPAEISPLHIEGKHVSVVVGVPEEEAGWDGGELRVRCSFQFLLTVVSDAVPNPKSSVWPVGSPHAFPSSSGQQGAAAETVRWRGRERQREALLFCFPFST